MAEVKKSKTKITDKNNSEGISSPKSESNQSSPKKENASLVPKVSLLEKIFAPFAFIYNEQFQKVFGLTLLLSATFLSFSFISYPFTWENDYSKVVGNLFSPEVKVENWFGKFGALLSHIFIYKWFGLASFVFPFMALLAGLRITFNVGPKNIYKVYALSFFFLVFSSVTLGYLITDPAYIYFGGAYGYTISNLLNSLMGCAGTGMVLFFVFLVFLVIACNFSFNLNKTDALQENTESPKEVKKEVEEKATEEQLIEKKHAEATLQEELERHDIEEDEFEITPSIKDEILLSSSTEDVQFTVESPPIKEEDLSPQEIAAALTAEIGEYDPTLDLASYQFPTIDLLENYGGSKDITINKEELNANKDRIIKTLGDYGIEIEKIKATVGPTVTLYEIVPAAGVRISKIKNLEDDIALSLSALGIRIIAPIPGKGTIGIEVPNLNPDIVPMRTLIASEKFQTTTFDLPVVLGKTISNETFIFDLAKMPHLLMAGATGQGKSVGLNAVLVSLLYKKHPSQLKFVLVDPKKVELTLFNKIERHFLAKLPDSADAIITDTKKVIHTLNSLCIEMDNRYDLLKDAEVRNLKEYNTKFIARRLNPNNGHRFLPYIVLVVDEFADLIMTAGKEVEMPIARLAQLARAIGIHLVIATQRPSVNIITGTIKANFPARIAFRVSSKIDSRTILDSGGADQLIGRGDLLLSTGNDLIRLQCAFVDTPEVDKICNFIGSQRGYADAYLLPEFIDENGEGGGKGDLDPTERDSMFNQAAEIVVSTQQGSTSLIQRRLKLGYNRAGRIVDQLERAGIIGPFEGSKAREVLIKDLTSLEQYLNKTEHN
jgi:S-DNA-T family DNA segregation ATPase FtsK/SpoIIIE